MITSQQRAAQYRDPLSTENYAWLQKYVERLTGIAVGQDKDYFFESRLSPLVRSHKMESLNALCSHLRDSSELKYRSEIIEAITTNETSFYRDPAYFNALRDFVIPEIVNLNRASRQIRIWSAAASTGQEAYSVVILLLEAGLTDWRVEVVGTDISTQVLDLARAGKYQQMEVNRGLPSQLLVKYFQQAELKWQIKPEVMKRVKFQQFDLRNNMADLGRFDLVLCRNVLIYFDAATRRDILRRVNQTMHSHAMLVLGSTESIFETDLGFERRAAKNFTYYAKAEGSRVSDASHSRMFADLR